MKTTTIDLSKGEKLDGNTVWTEMTQEEIDKVMDIISKLK